MCMGVYGCVYLCVCVCVCVFGRWFTSACDSSLKNQPIIPGSCTTYVSASPAWPVAADEGEAVGGGDVVVRAVARMKMITKKKKAGEGGIGTTTIKGGGGWLLLLGKQRCRIRNARTRRDDSRSLSVHSEDGACKHHNRTREFEPYRDPPGASCVNSE